MESAAPRQCSRVNEKRSGWGESSLANEIVSVEAEASNGSGAFTAVTRPRESGADASAFGEVVDRNVNSTSNPFGDPFAICANQNSAGTLIKHGPVAAVLTAVQLKVADKSRASAALDTKRMLTSVPLRTTSNDSTSRTCNAKESPIGSSW